MIKIYTTNYIIKTIIMLSILVLMRAPYNCVISEQDSGNKITFHRVLSNLHLYCFSEKKLQWNVQKGLCCAWSLLDFIPSREAKWWLCFPGHDTQNVTQWLNGDLSQETKFQDYTAGLYPQTSDTALSFLCGEDPDFYPKCQEQDESWVETDLIPKELLYLSYKQKIANVKT